MTWFYVDDKLATHPKVMAAGNAAMGLWVRAGSWSMSQLTDGFIPAAMLPGLGGTKAHAERLVNAGLWDRMPTGYAFHDWEHWQFTADQVRKRRAERAKAGRNGGLAKARNHREGLADA